jgi:hypothetical protein
MSIKCAAWLGVPSLLANFRTFTRFDGGPGARNRQGGSPSYIGLRPTGMWRSQVWSTTVGHKAVGTGNVG